MEISIKTNFPEVQRALDQLQKDVGNKALASALNKSVAIAKTQMTQKIPREYNVSAGFVRERLRIVRANLGGGRIGIFAELVASGKRGRQRYGANLIAFVERATTLAQARKRAKAGTLKLLFVKVKRAGGRKAVKGQYGQGAFIGNKGRTVFEREPGTTAPKRSKYGGTKHAERIRAVTTVDVPQMFNTRRINRAVLQVVTQRLPEIFKNEAAFFLERFNRTGF